MLQITDLTFSAWGRKFLDDASVSLPPGAKVGLVGQMTAEPVVVQVLEGENAVSRYREVMGATNPEQAAEGTIRKQFALSIGENSVHGSDSLDNAKIEIAQFFTDAEIVG